MRDDFGRAGLSALANNAGPIIGPCGDKVFYLMLTTLSVAYGVVLLTTWLAL